jgi:hypothetical protein
MKRPFTKAGESTNLQDAALLLALVGLGQESSTGGGLKHLADAFIGACRALEVLVGSDLLADFLTLL